MPTRTPTTTPYASTTGRQLAAISAWVDDHPANATRDPEACLWGRVAKVQEEAGEAIAALIGVTGQNPRKGVTHSIDDVVAELLDVALTALCAVEHIRGNDGSSTSALDDAVARVTDRSGISVPVVSVDAPVPPPSGHDWATVEHLVAALFRHRQATSCDYQDNERPDPDCLDCRDATKRPVTVVLDQLVRMNLIGGADR